ncbi:hypothetical protein XHV734_5017 [Xanthomonas hortorum pv. vitians]|nr:hypothetical protein XHV734_5017 [Xanthomonas hortorum pv. vitians]
MHVVPELGREDGQRKPQQRLRHPGDRPATSNRNTVAHWSDPHALLLRPACSRQRHASMHTQQERGRRS